MIAGFTLIELLVGVGIVGILMFVAVPSFNTLLYNYRVSSAANTQYGFLQQARSESIKRNIDVYVSFATGDSWCLGLNTSSACDCTIPASCNLGTTSATSPAQVTVSLSGYSGNSFFYEGTHGMASASGTVTLTRYGSSELITLGVGRMGSVSMCSTGIGGYPAC